LEEESKDPNFWDNPERAGEISQEISDLREEIDNVKQMKTEVEDLEELQKLTEDDPDIAEELEQKYQQLKSKVKKEEFKLYLSGKYDNRDAILQIQSGAGGTDAEDWATMLIRMYKRYCEKKGFSMKVLDQSFGEAGGPNGRVGTKSATLEAKGRYAFGYLKKESGVHRIVRTSPFSAKDLRHTSFASVEVLPKLGSIEESEIEIKPEDLEIDTFRASGPGGQYVNRRESAVRITHLPTKITVSVQSERLQGQNKRKAMEVLYSKLYQKERRKKEKELKKIKGEETSVSWGNQIRSYVLHPYQMVKDLRTGVETSDVEGVLDGEIEKFVKEEVKLDD